MRQQRQQHQLLLRLHISAAQRLPQRRQTHSHRQPAHIQQQLQKLSVDELKKRYQFEVVQTAPEELAQEIRLAELKLIYLQLQDFYRDAARQNLAVLSVFQTRIKPEKLI